MIATELPSLLRRSFHCCYRAPFDAAGAARKVMAASAIIAERVDEELIHIGSVHCKTGVNPKAAVDKQQWGCHQQLA